VLARQLWNSLLEWYDRGTERHLQKLNPERVIVVSIDDDGIVAKYPQGEILAVRWSSATKVWIETNDSGPSGSDFWWVVESNEGRCVFPDGATGASEAAQVLKERLKGFDSNTVREAVGSTDNAVFVCWEKHRAGQQRLATDKVREVCPPPNGPGAVVEGGPCS
jgi:hypothetical protein